MRGYRLVVTTFLAFAMVAGALAAEAQQAGKPPRVGVLYRCPTGHLGAYREVVRASRRTRGLRRASRSARLGPGRARRASPLTGQRDGYVVRSAWRRPWGGERR